MDFIDYGDSRKVCWKTGEPLTLRAPLRIILSIFKHLRLVISLNDGFAGETFHPVVFTVVVVDFFTFLASFGPRHLRYGL